jgi:hypothetical protein
MLIHFLIFATGFHVFPICENAAEQKSVFSYQFSVVSQAGSTEDFA